jgi:hypothetical protein
MAAQLRPMVSCVMPSNLPDFVTNKRHCARWKAAFFDLLYRQNYTHAISLVWNGAVPHGRIRSDLKRFHRMVDKKLLGSRCERYPREKRSRAVFMVEGVVEGHSHVHSFWRFPPGKLISFNRLFPGERGGLWNDLIPQGTYAMAMISPICRNDEFSGYLLKRQNPNSPPEEIIWSEDFLPDR